MNVIIEIAYPSYYLPCYSIIIEEQFNVISNLCTFLYNDGSHLLAFNNNLYIDFILIWIHININILRLCAFRIQIKQEVIGTLKWFPEHVRQRNANTRRSRGLGSARLTLLETFGVWAAPMVCSLLMKSTGTLDAWHVVVTADEWTADR